MEIDSKELLDKINKSIGARDVFKNNTEDLVKGLIYAAKKRYNNVISSNYDYIFKDNLANDYIRQYRTILKFIFAYSSMENKSTMDSKTIVDNLTDLFILFQEKYAETRNYLAQCSLGKRKIDYDLEKNLYYEKKYDDYSAYARSIDKISSNEDIGMLKINAQRDVLKWYSSNDYKLSRTIMNNLYEINKMESEIQFEYDFGIFTYNDLLWFCAGLKFIGYYYNTDYMHNFHCIEEKELKSFLRRLTKLEDKKIELFLDMSTYNVEYQKDKLTLFQPLVKFGNRYYFLCFTLMAGMLPLKMIRVIHDLYFDEKIEKAWAEIAKEKENQMLNDLTKVFDNYDVEVSKNYIVMNSNGKSKKAEYDLLIYDKKEYELYICECKWFYIKDDEEDNLKLDEKIKDGINKRDDKDKYLEQNINNIGKDIFSSFTKVNKCYRLLISQNNLGSIKFKIPVLDYKTLLTMSKKHSDFKGLMNSLFNEDYKKDIKIETFKQKYEIEGYNFEIFRIGVKRDEIDGKR